PLVRKAVEVTLEVGIHHDGEPFLEQAVDLAQRVMAASSRTETVAPLAERRLEDRFDDQLHRRLDNTILDRRDTQRPRSPVTLGDFHPPDRLGTIAAVLQRDRPLAQVLPRVRCEPLETLAVHPGRALVGPD